MDEITINKRDAAPALVPGGAAAVAVPGFHVVLVEDDDADAELMIAELASADAAMRVTRARNEREVRASLSDLRSVDAILCDYFLPSFDALRILELIRESAFRVPLIVISGGLSDERAAECMRLGATDYILKDRLSRLPYAVTRAIEQARADTASREVERSYRSLFENLPMAVFRATTDGQILRANAAAVAMFGFKDLAGLCATSEFELHADPEDRRALLVRLQAQGHLTDFERRMRRADGTEFWFDGSIHEVRDGAGPTQVWESIGRDSTDRRLAERALAESDQRLRSLLAGAPVAVVTLDRKGRITYAGGTVFAQLGVDPGSLVGQLVADRFGDRPEIIELLRNALKEDLQADLEFARWTFHVRCGPHRMSPDGEVVGVLAVGFDNTERVEADRALRRVEVEAEKRLFGRVAQQGVLLELSRAGLERGESLDFLTVAVELVTKGARAEFGTILEARPSQENLVRVATYGLGEGVLLAPAPLDVASRAFEALATDSPVMRFDYRAQPEIEISPWMIESGVVASMAVGIRGPVSPFGVLSVHCTTAREFDADDVQFMQLASTIISVSVERKRGEQQRRMLLRRLVTAQEAERKTIAEDIHDDAVQVMTAANMRLELFRMSLTDPVQVEAADKLQETITLATGRLRTLLFELTPPDLDSHGLAATLTRHLEQFEVDAGARWELAAELQSEPPPQVRLLLFRIFQEAIANIRKHAHASSVVVALKTEEGGVMMRIADDGRGFHQTAAEPRPGHLGLASMRERAEIAGGWWRLTSEPGKGTEILSWVPTPDESESETEETFGVRGDSFG